MGSNQGITQIINTTFANHFATEMKNNPLTFIIGKFSGEQTEDVSSDSAKDTLAGAVVGKTVGDNVSDNISLVTKRINWRKGAIFNPYNPNTAENTNHYGLVEDNGVFSVFLCLSNGEGYESGLISTIKPSGNFGTVIKLEDGYKWLKLYTVTGTLSQFLTSNFMPVPDFSDITSAPTNSSLRLSQKTVDLWKANRGGILRVELDSSLKNVRWDSQPKFELRQIPANPGSLNFIFSNDTDNSDLSRRGFKLERVDVLSSGSGYTNTVNAFSLDTEPSYTENDIDSDHIVGNDYNNNIKKYGPLVRLITFAGYLNYASVLGADRTMLVFSIDASEIQQTTSVTTFDSVAIVQNLKTKDDDTVSIESKVGKNKTFRMSDIITTSASNSFAVGNEIQGAVITSNTRGTGAKVAAKPAANQVEVVRHDGEILAADKVWSPSTTKTSTTISSKQSDSGGFSLSTSTQIASAEGQYLGTSTSNSAPTVSSVEKGEGKLSTDSLVLYSNTLGAGDAIDQAQGIQVRFIVGGSELLPV